ncbi:MAG: methylmalonyl Co-A mutase-associated GTPase MeaB, partial [Nitrospira sp.]|nr:methylmalonyl Co-A mutase-associated GTPase MeaB [Nitrospira sp.]
LEAAGYGVILIETVGVGQGEIEVAKVASTVVAVVAPGLGDEVQAMKAGLLEIAHIIVVNKSDRPDADRTLRELRDWHRVVLPITATTGDGISGLIAAIAEQQRFRDLETASARAAS